MSYSTTTNSIPFEQPRPSSDSSTSSHPTTSSSPGKKKQSILRKLSTSSKRSLSWLPGIQDLPPLPTVDHHQHEQQQQQQPEQQTAKTTSSPNSNNNQQSAKHVIGKGMRNVARTVKKSLHQFDRPRSITTHQPSPQPISQPEQPGPRNPANLPPTPQPTIRSRAVSTPHAKNINNNSNFNSLARSLNQQPDPNSDPIEHSPATPPRSPKRLKKKNNRPQSAFEPLSPQPALLPQDHPTRLSWHAQTPIGSLPMAATLLAAPSPPPVDHSTFLAILPGQQPPSIPALSLIPPPPSQQVEPAALTAMSTGVEPALSRRVSLSSNNGGAGLGAGLENSSAAASISDDDNLAGFTFIRTPSKNPPSLPPSPSPLLSSSWTEIVNGHLPAPSPIETIEITNRRPPLVSASTAISLVQSCVAEHGSIGDPDDGEQQDRELVPQAPRKRKVTSFTNGRSPTKPLSPSSKEIVKEEEERQEEERQHKVARAALDKPFSSCSSSPSTTIHTNPSKYTSTTAHPLNFLPLLTPSSSIKSRKSSAKKHPRSRKSPFNSLHRAQSHKDHCKQDDKAASDVWNFSVVSTVVGVVLIAVVLIGSTNLSGINYNGKSWLGNWIKKIV